MWANGQCNAPAALPSGRAQTLISASWVSPRASLDGFWWREKKSFTPGRDQTLDCLAYSKSLYQLCYLGSFKDVSTSDYTAGVVSYTISGSHTSEGNYDKSYELIKMQHYLSSSNGLLYLLNHNVNFSYESHFFRKSFKTPFTFSLMCR
jgi:hypothetical protein